MIYIVIKNTQPDHSELVNQLDVKNTFTMEESPKLSVFVFDVFILDTSSGKSDQVWDPSSPVQTLINPRTIGQNNREQRARSSQSIKNKRNKNVSSATINNRLIIDSSVDNTNSSGTDNLR